MVKDLFESLLKARPIFKNKEVMRPAYIPDILPHRDTEIRHLAAILVAALRGETPSNVLIYGKTGTGKTAVVKYVGKELENKGVELGKPTRHIYLNCEIVDTQYRVLQNIANHFITEWSDRVPFTGWPTDEVYAKLKQMMDSEGGVTVITLDEIDKLKGDEVLYNLTRINSDLKRAKVSVLGISNDLKFTEFLDPRVKSSLGEENMIFPPYDADQLRDILNQRAKMAFREDVTDEGVIARCAALAAQEHGDARRALDLLRVAAEIAERDKAKEITEKHVKLAQNKIELDRVTEVTSSLPMQSKLVLFSIIVGEDLSRAAGQKMGLTTGEVFDIYKELCKKTGADVLTQRRIADLISELDMLGIITARVISKGRYGRTREIQMSAQPDKIREVLGNDELLSAIRDFRPRIQSRLGGSF
ncbi:MAG: cell division control protein Cdc6 [Thermoplasmata archaeon HGW-Thermoplasmata-1]|nr:MAG: cell division control protein Cdc6 [Thermoplasmata archaeon HGW-Thermoplasmata-1]